MHLQPQPPCPECSGYLHVQNWTEEIAVKRLGPAKFGTRPMTIEIIDCDDCEYHEYTGP